MELKTKIKHNQSFTPEPKSEQDQETSEFKLTQGTVQSYPIQQFSFCSLALYQINQAFGFCCSKMNAFYLPISSFSAFAPYKGDSLEKTRKSNDLQIVSQTSTVTQEYDMTNDIPSFLNVLKTSDTNFNALESKMQKKERRGSLKLKKGNEENDYQYRPNKRISKKEPNSKLNENRNILPNTIHQLFSFGQRRNRSGDVVERIFKKYLKKQSSPSEEEYSITRFYIYQKHLKNKIGNYVTEEALRMVCNDQISPELFDSDEQNFYNKVFRILILSYLKEEANCSVLMSKRMYNDKKIQHIKTNRYLVERMAQNFPLNQS